MTRPRYTSIALAILLQSTAACSGGNHRAGAPSTSHGATSTTEPARVTLTLKLDGTTAIGPNGAKPLATATIRDAVQLVHRYVSEATQSPLRTGNVGSGFLDLFTLDAALRLRAGAGDRATLTDAGLGQARAPTAIAGSLRLNGLINSAGRVVMVSAGLNTGVTIESSRGKTTVVRSGELLLVPGPAGRWLIAGYDVRVVSVDGAGQATTTTAASTGTSTP